jgi:hypothetical protein
MGVMCTPSSRYEALQAITEREPRGTARFPPSQPTPGPSASTAARSSSGPTTKPCWTTNRLAEQEDIGAAISPNTLLPGNLAVWDCHVAMIVGNNNVSAR